MKSILFIAVVGLLISCSYNKSELPQPLPPGSPEPEPITYTNFVKNMIDSNYCLLCHFDAYNDGSVTGPAGGRSFETYEGIRDAALDNVLQARAIDGGAPTMPLGFPELPQEIKDSLQMWIDQGALE